MANSIEIIINASDHASGPIGNVNHSLGTLGSTAGQSTGMLGRFGSSLGSIGTIAAGVLASNALQGIIGGIQGMIGSALTAYADNERLGMSLETLMAKELRTADANLTMNDALAKASPLAKELLGWTQKLAIESPFTQDTVARTLQTMMGYGMTSDMAKDLSGALIDMAAGAGKGEAEMQSLGLALGQVWAKGKLSGQEMLQLTDAGLGVADVARAAGLPMDQFANAMEKGQISAKQLVPALVALLKEDYGGAAKRQATSWAGLLSTFDDIKKVGLREFFAGTFQAIQPYVSQFVDQFSSPAFIARLQELGQVLGEKIGMALQWLATTVMPVVLQAFAFVQEHADAFKGALIGIAAVLAGAGIAVLIGAVAGVIAALVGPIGLVIAGVMLLGAAWSTNWGGIRDTLTAIWNTQLQPMLSQLYVWLQVNLPIALQNLSTFWNGTLLPAIQAVWAFVNDNVFPLLNTLYQWFAFSLPLVIQELSVIWNTVLLPAIEAVWQFVNDFVFPLLATLYQWIAYSLPIVLNELSIIWNNVLLPAIQAVWAFIDQILLPVLKALANIGLAVVELGVKALMGAFQHLLLPALQAVWGFIDANVLPILKALSGVITDVLGPPVLWMANTVLAGLRGAFDAVASAVQSVVGWINTVADALRNVKLPGWLTPGSPTPFENGLRGIASAMSDLSSYELPRFSGQLQLAGVSGMSRANNAYSTNNTFNVTVNGTSDLTGTASQLTAAAMSMAGA